MGVQERKTSDDIQDVGLLVMVCKEQLFFAPHGFLLTLIRGC